MTRIGRFAGTALCAVATVSVATPAAVEAAEVQPATLVETFNGIAEGGGAPDPAAAAKEAWAAGLLQPAAVKAESKTVAIEIEQQRANMWCAPASGRAVISAFDSTPPDQRDVATRMGTSLGGGTQPGDIAPALNAFQSSNAYVRSTSLSLASYRSSIRASLRSYGAPSIAGVEMDELPWSDATGSHAVTIYGYEASSTVWNVHVFDPWRGTRHPDTESNIIYEAGATVDNRLLVW